MEAFVAACDAGADGVELDVRATVDRALAVHHDRHIPGVANVTNVALADLPRDVPTLSEALAACGGLAVNVEIKGGPEEAALVADALGAEEDDTVAGVCVSSFDVRSVAAVRRLAPWLPAGLLVGWDTRPEAALETALGLGCATLHPFVTQVDDALVDAAHAAGIGLHVWTVNADADLARMRDLGVDAVITDRIDAARRVLRAPRNGGGSAG